MGLSVKAQPLRGASPSLLSAALAAEDHSHVKGDPIAAPPAPRSAPVSPALQPLYSDGSAAIPSVAPASPAPPASSGKQRGFLELLVDIPEQLELAPHPIVSSSSSGSDGDSVGSSEPEGQACITPHFTDVVHKKISTADFEMISPLGSGGFGSVFLVRYRDTGKVYALKVMQKDRLIQREQAHYVMAEKAILLAAGQHPFIADLHCSFQSAKRLYLVLKFCGGGELFFRLRQEKMLDEASARFYAAEVALAVAHLHALGIVHRDLKPENILLDAEGHIAVTDFGLGRQNIDSERALTMAGTEEYMAPEIVAGKGYGKEVDWYSLGCLLFEMLTNDPPFPRPKNGNKKDLHRAILAGKFKLPSYLSNEARSLLKGLLHKDPAQRLGSRGGIDEIKKHPFFYRRLDFDKLLARRVAPPFLPALPNGECDVTNFDPRATAGGRASGGDVSRLLDGSAAPLPAPIPAKRPDEDAFASFSYVHPSLFAALCPARRD